MVFPNVDFSKFKVDKKAPTDIVALKVVEKKREKEEIKVEDKGSDLIDGYKPKYPDIKKDTSEEKTVLSKRLKHSAAEVYQKMSHFFEPSPVKIDYKMSLYGVIWTTISRWVTPKTVGFFANKKLEKKQQKIIEDDIPSNKLKIYKELYEKEGIKLENTHEMTSPDEYEIEYDDIALQRLQLVEDSINKL